MKRIPNYRQHADECEAMARTATTQKVRDHYLALAKTWREMADEIEASEAKKNGVKK